ncbi:hypothetical protein MKZ38_006526 [Zalerion maritima]|uniref:Uncharacterized protein n=1 Tax=Zalerion maritima TaxID=339359 RepID=A0AAD5RYP9_9PEZI|nr:hypothetical protein MKZ38_006526 [Zalerion maritima]
MRLTTALGFLLPFATALPVKPNGASDIANRAPSGLKDFNLGNLNTHCSRQAVEMEWTCTLTYRWQDPNWSNATGPECTTVFRWDGDRNTFTDYNQDFSICWQDMESDRKLPAFQHSITSFTSPGHFTLGLVDHVIDHSLKRPWDVRACFSYPEISLSLVYKSDLKIEYRTENIIQAVITSMSA